MSQKTDNFIAKYKDAVIAASRGTGIFPSVTMAQMIIESGWGQTVTATKANNFFGIKADPAWTGKSMLFNTPKDAKKQNYFRVYDNPKDSIADHEHFLIQNHRYSVDDAEKHYSNIFSAKTPEDQAHKLAAARYSENYNTYAGALIAMIDAYKLKDLDRAAGLSVSNTSTANVLLARARQHWGAIAIGTAIFATSLFLVLNSTSKKSN